MGVEKGINTTTVETSKKLFDVINLQREFDILEPDIVKSALTHKHQNNRYDIYLGNDEITFKISKLGYVNPYIKGVFIKGNVRTLLLSKLVELSEPTGENYIVGRYTYEGIIYNNKLLFASYENKKLRFVLTEKRMKEILENTEYRVLKEELNYVHHIEKEPSVEVEPDEVYSNNPEDFISRECELKELLNVVLKMKNRKLFPEEIELLKEISSEIEFLI
jgi:hypothetical protein